MEPAFYEMLSAIQYVLLFAFGFVCGLLVGVGDSNLD